MRPRLPRYQPTKHNTKKVNDRAISLIKIDTKILNKVLAYQFQQCIERIIHHVPDMWDWLKLENQSVYHIYKLKAKKSRDYVNWCRKIIKHNLTPMHVEISQWSRNRTFSTLILKKSTKTHTVNIVLNDNKLDVLSLRLGKVKGISCCHCYSSES